MWRLLFLLLFPFTVAGQLKRFEFSAYKMGAPFNLIFYHSDSAEAAIIAKECFAMADTLNDIFSDYGLTSEVAGLTDQVTFKDIKVSDELFTMIILSKQAWKKTDRAFDITAGSLTQLWRKARSGNRFPPEFEIMQAKALTGFENIRYNKFRKTVSFKKQGMKMDFGGIVPGYTAQKIINRLRSKNILSALVDASGDIAVSGPPPGKNGWIVAVNLPESDDEVWEKKLELKNLAVSTSGDVYRFIIHNGMKYSHIIDPRTGYGVRTQKNVTVVANDGATADWLATACSILPIKKALRLCKREQAAVFMATLEKGTIVIHKSKNFDRFFQNTEQ